MKKGTMLVMLAILLAILIYSVFYNAVVFYKVEPFEQRTHVPITLHSFWEFDHDGEKEGIISLFSYIFQFVNNYKEIQIYSVFGDTPSRQEPDILYVQFSGESYFNSPNLFNVNFIPENPINAENVVLFPFGAFQIYMNTFTVPGYDLNVFLKPREYTNPTRFCLFAVSNASCKVRNDFFQELSKYKQVDSCGSVMNNMGFRCPGIHSSKEQLDFISQYKFMICFENKSQPHYFTEKLMNAYYGGTIPIYWGDPRVFEYINRDAILYLKPDFTKEDLTILINEIIGLDNDDEAYQKKHECPLFRNGEFSEYFDLQKISEKTELLLLKH
jgi:hypothetical protein